MAAISKSAPLVTYYSSLSSSREAATETPEAAPIAPVESAHGRSRRSAGSVVILTILGQAKEPVAEDYLRAHCELAPERYEQALKEFFGEGLIQADNGSYKLTEKGRVAAEHERARLLSPS